LNIVSGKIGAIEKIKLIKQLITKKRYREAVIKLQTGMMPIHWKVFFTLVKLKNAFAVYCLLTVMNKLRGKV